MADAALRRLERTAETPQDEVHLFMERARRGLLDWRGWECACLFSTGICGSLTSGTGGLGVNGYWEHPCTHVDGRASLEDRLALAAYCGHEGAREMVPFRDALGIAPGGLLATEPEHVWRFIDEAEPDRWLSGLTRWPGAPVRAAVAAAWVALGVWMARHRAAAHNGHKFEWAWCGECLGIVAARKALEAAERWLEGTEEARVACAVLCYSSLEESSLPRFAWELLCWISDVRDDGTLLRQRDRLRDSMEAAAEIAGEETVRAAICERLVGWALSREAAE